MVIALFVIALFLGLLLGLRWLYRRYAVAGEMEIPVREFSNAEYPVGSVRTDLSPKEMVLGIDISGQAKAYPLSF
jgi:hypothetical protein